MVITMLQTWLLFFSDDHYCRFVVGFLHYEPFARFQKLEKFQKYEKQAIKVMPSNRSRRVIANKNGPSSNWEDFDSIRCILFRKDSFFIHAKVLSLLKTPWGPASDSLNISCYFFREAKFVAAISGQEVWHRFPFCSRIEGFSSPVFCWPSVRCFFLECLSRRRRSRSRRWFWPWRRWSSTFLTLTLRGTDRRRRELSSFATVSARGSSKRWELVLEVVSCLVLLLTCWRFDEVQRSVVMDSNIVHDSLLEIRIWQWNQFAFFSFFFFCFQKAIVQCKC